jgi:hypothetical protein
VDHIHLHHKLKWQPRLDESIEDGVGAGEDVCYLSGGDSSSPRSGCAMATTGGRGGQTHGG